ncbi:Ran guanyl-nucleotide exchange factor [Starmerella bacillaris]|uniref:Ran guanyl-nucleotide exchange factor n=1 Tax=Starmerella bacillaris TaxID=1247836 RepID=A0AAV5RL86_STABA|nr:Ran guanyl-nucleotide exchange factor [Starmerella bacillaris]
MGVKRARTETTVPVKRARGKLNELPKLSGQKLDVFAFGTGTICELGLGPEVTEVKRPRLSPLLPADEVGIVALAAGGAHSLAVDHEGQLWSWGQNDTGCLGRDTRLSDAEIDEDLDLNPKESTPAKVTGIRSNISFVKVCATDSASAALTPTGNVYAWGTFIDDGHKSFSAGVEIQYKPERVPIQPKIVALASGKDHFLALTVDGHVYAWGVGTSFQLGVHVRSGRRTSTAGPLRVPGVDNIVSIAAGDYTSYAIDSTGKVFSWGLNNFGQCGISDPVGPKACIETPTHAEFWDDKHIVQIAAGGHHSLWLTKEGTMYTVGEINFNQLGVPIKELPENTVREQDGTPSYVPTPLELKWASDEEEPVSLPKMKFIACGTDHNIALSQEDGSIWTWGFGSVYQLGHGKTGDDGPEEEEVPRHIRNTATKERNMVWAGAGGQYSITASVHV